MAQRRVLGGKVEVCPIIVGLWQLSGGHGRIDVSVASREILRYIENGFVTFDGADHYGPAEEVMGAAIAALAAGRVKAPEGAPTPRFFTKWVPRPQPMTRDLVEANIGRSLRRMGTPALDLLQFHWYNKWDYDDPAYIDAMRIMGAMPQIRHLALTNFDTEHMGVLVQNGITIVSNQVSYSLVDRRPEYKMVPFCQKHSIHLLTYGTLLGGFLSDRYLGRPEPTKAELTTSSLGKYLPFIRSFGGWPLFQDLLACLRTVADRHQVAIANVAVRWVLDRPQVGGVIIGARLGIADHIDENKRTLALQLDDRDRADIDAVLARARPLKGDCGDEYRYQGIP